MTPEEALQLIDSVLAQVPATRQQHVQLQLAISVLKQEAPADAVPK